MAAQTLVAGRNYAVATRKLLVVATVFSAIHTRFDKDKKLKDVELPLTRETL
jgi:hypothetical protein